MLFLISNFCHVLNVVFILLGDSPASESYIPTFRNTLFRNVGIYNSDDGESPTRKKTTRINVAEVTRTTPSRSGITYKDRVTLEKIIFTVVPSIVILSKFFYQLMHKRIALKGILKFTLKQLRQVSV
jgi:hypothetical protein